MRMFLRAPRLLQALVILLACSLAGRAVDILAPHSTLARILLLAFVILVVSRWSDALHKIRKQQGL